MPHLMDLILRILLPVLLAVAVGCGTIRSGSATRSGQSGALANGAAAAPATQPSADASDRARLHLDQIEPVPQLPEARTVPEGDAPLEAIELFAQARGMIHQRPRDAVGLLERAILLDQESYELYYTLGEAHLAGGSGNEKALEAFEKAAELRPASIEVRLQLARQYLTRNRFDRALHNLRLALQTPGYQKDNEDSAMVDLLLARVLQQLGYDQAALDYYQRTLARVTRPSPQVRRNPELLFLISRPELLELQIAELADKLGQRDRAIAALRSALRREPNEFELHARLLRTLAQTGNIEQTTEAALELVRRFRASDPAMKLLREVYGQLERSDALADDLQLLHEQHPADKPIMLALVDVLQEQGKVERAEALLADSLLQDPSDAQVLRRLVASLDQRDQVQEAARWLVESAARQPATMWSTADLWANLLQPGRKVRLKLTDLRRMEVAEFAEAARQFWVSRLAGMWNRETLSREALHRSVEHETVFAPAYRLLLVTIWRRPDYQEATKVEQSLELIAQAAAKGDIALAEELKGLLAIQQKQPEQALSHLAAAMAIGTPSPELQINYADALVLQGDLTRAEQTLWKLISDWPRFGEGYEKLFSLYLQRRQAQQAVRVLETWLAADPASVDARLLRAVLLAQMRQTEAAEQLLLQLFEEAPDNEQVLGTLQALCVQSGRNEEWVRLLEREREKHPDNHQVVGLLVDAYSSRKREAEAISLIDAARARAAGEPDLLYFLAHLYNRVGHKTTANQVLEEVITIDPTHAAAANDLGYSWADDGVNLDRAEALIRLAVDQEPDNQAFLDSLAWVLYKRSKFTEARRFLDQALDAALRPDPVVVDHLGDTLYRLGLRKEAAEQWQRAMDMLAGISQNRSDLVELRLALTRKLRAVEHDEEVPVAPVVEGPVDIVESRAPQE